MKYERTERERSECLEPPFDGDNREPFADAAPAPSRRLSWGLRLLLYMMSGLRIGRLDIVLPDGSWRRFDGTAPGPHGVWQIRDGKLISYLLAGGEVGVGDAYLADCWDTPDLTQLLMVMYLNEPHYKGPFEKNWFGRLFGYWRHRQRANTRRRARRNIEHHYDLGNAFYRLWLDETMAYSAAVFPRGDGAPPPAAETLAAAQQNKFRLMYERLALGPEHRLLEIGSGWGGFAIYAAQHAGCRVHSITLSAEQLAEAQRRAHAAGVADRVHFELRDYRDIAGHYDRVASIEMYEAVGEAYWPGYFATIAAALRPGGRAAIQGITINPAIFPNYRNKRDFIQKYIFPGGMLCPPGRLLDLAAQAGLKPRDAKFYGEDYADTLAIWHRNVVAAREAVVRQFDARFLRMWRYYLSYCECGFRTGSIDLLQVTFDKT
jgi:cyclopropane-fatty-acyl-phospholipid synthase